MIMDNIFSYGNTAVSQNWKEGNMSESYLMVIKMQKRMAKTLTRLKQVNVKTISVYSQKVILIHNHQIINCM